MNGVSCVYSVTFTRSRPSAKTNRLWLGMRTTLCTTASVPTAEQVGRLRSVDARLALRDHDDGLVFTQGIDQLHRTLAADGQRQDRMRKQHGVANGQQRQSPRLG